MEQKSKSRKWKITINTKHMHLAKSKKDRIGRANGKRLHTSTTLKGVAPKKLACALCSADSREAFHHIHALFVLSRLGREVLLSLLHRQ